MASGYGSYKVVDEGHVGGQARVAPEWATIRVVFHNFAELPSERGNCTWSPDLKCHGLKWEIQLYPGGGRTSSEANVFVSLFLTCTSCTNTNKIKAKYRIRVPSPGRAIGGEASTIFASQTNDNERVSPSWGYSDFAKRDDVLYSNYLVDGNLTVEVDIQVLDKPPTWTPTNTISADMLALFDTAGADNTDVAFEAASGDGKEIVYAHGLILAARCPTLASLAEGCDPETPIPIGDVQADVFRMLLRYVYGGKVPCKDVIKDQAKDIIHATDKYGCTGLKLAAEAEMAAAGITTENAAELILFADATNCAMLKETAMEFFVKKGHAVMASEGFEQVKESPAILTELMAVALGGNKVRPASSDADGEKDYKRMRVAELRRELNDMGLDVDGSKEVLVARLEEFDIALAQAEDELLAQAEAARAQEAAENEDGDA